MATNSDRPLSARELEILQVLAEGSTEVETGLALDLSPYTINAHKQRIYTKLGVHSLPEALRVARKRKLISV